MPDGPYLPGDVLTVWDPRNPLPAWAIRIGGWLRGHRSAADHVVVAHHTDPGGVLWGIEGRPGGVGWVDVATYPNITSSNAGQPKTDAQRIAICEAAVGLLGTPYDWVGILADARQALRIDHLWRSRDFGDTAPAHVVCSSVADWLTERVGLASPGGTADTRWTTPPDWESFNRSSGWA